MEHPVSDQSQESMVTPPNESTNHSFFSKRSNVIGMLAVLITIAAIPLTVKLSQQRQDIRQRAASSSDYCSFEAWKTDGDFLRGNNSLGTEIKQFPPTDTDPEHKDSMVPGPPIEKGQPVTTTRFKYDGTVDWAVAHGPNMITKYDPKKDRTRGALSGRSYTESNWSVFLRRMDGNYFSTYSSEISSRTISTGVLMKYTIMGLVRGNLDNLSDEQGGSDSSAGTSATQSNKNFTDFLAGNLKVVNSTFRRAGSTESLVGQTITLPLLADLMGFDVTVFTETELRKTLASIRENGSWNMQEIKDRMIADSATCSAPAAVPTASTPVNCEEKLLVPPAGFRSDFPSYSKNPSCPEMVAMRNASATGRTELDICGEYWLSAWCNGNKENAIFACRGWSQNSQPNKPELLVYFNNRIFTITSTKNADNTYSTGGLLVKNIAQFGDVIGRKKTWNFLFQGVKDKTTAYPYEFDNVNKSPEEVNNNALNAASQAIFSKPWGAVIEQERLNNCPTRWDGTNPAPTSTTPNATPTASIPNPSLTPNPNGTVLNFTVILHGIGAGGDSESADTKTSTKNPKTDPRNAVIIISDSNDSPESRKEKRTTIKFDTTTGKYTGSVDISDLNIATGNHSVVKIRTDYFLTKRFNAGTIAIAPGQVTTLPVVQLIAGDADKSNELNVADYQWLRDCATTGIAAKPNCTGSKKTEADFNDDGVVNNVDENLFKRELAHRIGE